MKSGILACNQHGLRTDSRKFFGKMKTATNFRRRDPQVLQPSAHRTISSPSPQPSPLALTMQSPKTKRRMPARRNRAERGPAGAASDDGTKALKPSRSGVPLNIVSPGDERTPRNPYKQEG